MTKFIKDGFKSLFRSGAAFTEKILPKFLRKTGVPEKFSSTIGKTAGSIAGALSIVTGAYFLIAIPVSMPMFLVATGMLPVKGSIAAVIATALLGSTGTVVTTTGFGMCRAAAQGLRNTFGAARRHMLKSPSAPVAAAAERSSFRVTTRPAAAFSGASASTHHTPIVKPEAASVPRGITPKLE
jgi:hypothetical protein